MHRAYINKPPLIKHNALLINKLSSPLPESQHLILVMQSPSSKQNVYKVQYVCMLYNQFNHLIYVESVCRILLDSNYFSFLFWLQSVKNNSQFTLHQTSTPRIGRSATPQQPTKNYSGVYTQPPHYSFRLKLSTY